MKEEKYLPVGTVVTLNGGEKKCMIIGFCSIGSSDKTKIYDYSGCLYPEGIISSDKTLLFNHDQIKEIHHMGFIDDEEKKFKETLKDINKMMSIDFFKEEK